MLDHRIRTAATLAAFAWLLTAAAPILIEGKTRGAVFLEQAGDQLLALRDRAVTRLFDLTLLASACSVIVMFGLATWISFRIGRLRLAAAMLRAPYEGIRHDLTECLREGVFAQPCAGAKSALPRMDQDAPCQARLQTAAVSTFGRHATHYRPTATYTLPSVEVPRACKELAQQCGPIDQPARDHVHDPLLALQLSLDFEKPRFEQRAALLSSNTLPDNQVDLAALVLERQERDSVGALRPLAHQHDAGSPDHPAVRNAAEIARAQQTVTQQLVT